MATMNFSVPENVKEAFNTTFQDRNKSAVIADLMQEAVAREQRKQKSHAAIGRILENQRSAPILTEEEIRAAREQGRP